MSAIESTHIPATQPSRATTSTITQSDQCPSFLITAANRSYKHQYANIYFVRLRILRQFVEERARKRWKNVSDNPVLVPRVLEVVKSQICWVVGTVYMDMPLKPNVLEDIARDQSIPPPPPLSKFCSPEDNVMLEDESGRIRLVGECVKSASLVTGVIIAVLGAETPNGEFEVVDVCHAGMAPHAHGQVKDVPVVQDDGMDIDEENSSDEWIALVSGLDIGSPSSADAQVQLLIEYLTGEGGGAEDQVSASRISRLIIAGNSLAPVLVGNDNDKKNRRYGYDSTSFSPHPTISLSAHLLDLAQVMPIHLLPGPTDPSGVILPQQPFPRAMFGAVSSYSSFTCETNPAYLTIGSTERDGKSESGAQQRVKRTFLVHSGQSLNDMWKYLPSPPATRLTLAESTLRWRHIAPTAPDTLWCHPYFTADPFIIEQTPDVYVIGDQPRLQTKMVVDSKEVGGSKRCRVILVPRFAETGILVLANLRTLGVRGVQFGVEGMGGEVAMAES